MSLTRSLRRARRDSLSYGSLAVLSRGGGAAEPPIVEATPLYSEDFSDVPDGTKLRSLPGWGWHSFAAPTGAERDRPVITGGQLAIATGGSVASTTGLVARDAVGPNYYMKFLAEEPTRQRRLYLQGIDERDWFFINDTGNTIGHTVSANKRIAGVSTSVASHTRTSGGRAPLMPDRDVPVGAAYEIRVYDDAVKLFIDGFQFPLAGSYDGYSVADMAGGTLVGISPSSDLHVGWADPEIGTLPCEITVDDLPLDFYSRKLGEVGPNGGRVLDVSGKFKGPVEGAHWGLFDRESEALVGEYQWVRDFVKIGSAWTGKIDVPAGANGKYAHRLGVRAVVGGEGLPWTLVKTNRVFAVGKGGVGWGQSNAAGFAGSSAGGASTSGVYQYNTPTWAESGGLPTAASYAQTDWVNNSGYHDARISQDRRAFDFCKQLQDQHDMPVGLLPLGVAARPASSLMPGRPEYDTYFLNNLANAMASFEYIIVNQGEDEASRDTATNPAGYKSNWATTIADMRSRSGQPSGTVIPVLMFLTGRYTSEATLPQENANANAIRTAQIELMESEIDDGYIAGHSFDLTLDGVGNTGVHFTAASYQELLRRAGLTARFADGDLAYDGRGPLATAFTRLATNSFSLAIDPNGATSLAGANLKGFDISLDGFAGTLTISDADYAGGVITFTTTGDDGVTQAAVRSMYGNNPDVSSQLIGTYADGTTIALFPVIVPLET